MRETTGWLWIGMEARSNYRAAPTEPRELPMDPHCNAVNSPLPKRGYFSHELVKQGWHWWGSEVCVRAYGTGRAGEGRMRGQERLVD